MSRNNDFKIGFWVWLILSAVLTPVFHFNILEDPTWLVSSLTGGIVSLASMAGVSCIFMLFD